MAFVKKTWLARIGAGLNKFRLGAGGEKVELINEPDSISQQGDALSATNLNDLEARIEEGFQTGIMPKTNNFYNIGDLSHKYDKIFANTIYASNVVNPSDYSVVPFLTKEETYSTNTILRYANNAPVVYTISGVKREYKANSTFKVLTGTFASNNEGSYELGHIRKIDFSSISFEFSNNNYSVLINPMFQTSGTSAQMGYPRIMYASYKSTGYVLLAMTQNNASYDFVDAPFSFVMIGV